MKRPLKLNIFIIYCLFLTITPACFPSEIPNYLLISPSTQANAMGQTFGAVTTSPLAAIMNPASAGLFAQKNDWGLEFFPGSVNWLQDYGTGIDFNAQALCMGMRYKNAGYPLSLGITLFQTRMLTSGPFSFSGYDGPEPLCACSVYGKSRGLGVSAAVDLHPLILSVGVNLKSVIINNRSAHADDISLFAWDYGFILDLPFFNTVNTRGYSNTPKLQPFFTPGFFISNTNIGDKFSFMDGDKVPLPRTFAAGIHIKGGIIHYWRRNRYKLVSWQWSREAEDHLAEYAASGTYVYRSGINDINIYKHILACKAGDDIVTKKGYEIGLGDVFFIRRGHYEDLQNNAIYRTKGWGLDITQSITLLTSLLRKKETYPNWFSHLHISINHVQYKTDALFHHRSPQYYLPLPNTDMTSITISL